MHRLLLRLQLGRDDGADLALAGGELEGNRASKAGMPPGPAAGRRHLCGSSPTPLGEHGLEGERLVVAQPVGGGGDITAVAGPVDPLQCGRPVEQAAAGPDLRRHRVLDAVEAVEREPDGVADLPRVDPFGRRVERDRAAGVLVEKLGTGHLVLEQLVLGWASRQRLLNRPRVPATMARAPGTSLVSWPHALKKVRSNSVRPSYTVAVSIRWRRWRICRATARRTSATMTTTMPGRARSGR